MIPTQVPSRAHALSAAIAVVAPVAVLGVGTPAGGAALVLPLVAIGFVVFRVVRSGVPRAIGWLGFGLALLALGVCAMPFVPFRLCGGAALPVAVGALLTVRHGGGLAVVWTALCAVGALVLGGALAAGVFSGHLIDLAERRAPVLLGAMALLPVASIGFMIAAGLDALGARQTTD